MPCPSASGTRPEPATATFGRAPSEAWRCVGRRENLTAARPEAVRKGVPVAGLHAAAFVLSALLGAPEELRAVLLSYALATTAFALLTPFVNLSLHAAGATGVLACLILVFGIRGALFAPVLPLVWWARTALGRHTYSELALGTLVGGGLTWLAFAMIA